jgi:hypothetical protein
VSAASDDDLLARVYSMSEDDDPEIERLRNVRSAFRAMADEDPPERGLAELMAAARVKAEEMKPVPWWQRIAATLRRPSVLALASVLVLIGGAVLIGRRGDDEVARPKVATEPPPAAATGGAAPAGAAGSSASVGGEDRMGDEKRDRAMAPDDQVIARPEPPKPTKPPSDDAPRPANLTPPVHHSTRSPVVTATPPADKVKEVPADPQVARDPEPKPTPKETKDKSGEAAGKEELVVQGQTDTAQPAPPVANVEAGAVDGRRGAAPRRATPEQMLQQCRSAADRGDCAAAKTIAARIAKDDAAFYRDRVAKDAAITRCLAK